MEPVINNPQDAFEFAVSQAVDGVLGDADRLALGDRLAGGDARDLAAGHERLNALLRDNDALPAVNFDAVAARFTAALADEPAYAPAPLRAPSAWPRRVAVAAGVAVAALVAWQVVPHRDRAAPAGEAIVRGPAETTPTAVAVADVRVGPSDAMVRQGLATGLGQEPAGGPKPRVVITSADNTSAGEIRPY